MKNKTIVIGSGRLGANIARHFSKKGISVDIIDISKDAFRKVSDDFSGNTIHADASDMTLLEQLDMDNVERIVIVTGDDNINVYIGHLAQYTYNIPKIYLRLYDTDKGKLIDQDRIKVIYPFLLSLDEFLDLEGAAS
ncbi:potassium channel family protein [Acholeplasma granularum]|uniref:potassium channel family protein n=1 Tax=Acholeplasma granularum TaxID=264635 RepID=UPI0004B6D00C|nr:NAD-binding protein [Acholeplasma granularum]